MILGIFAAIGAALPIFNWVRTTGRLNFKPFSCLPCLSFWMAVVYYLCYYLFADANEMIFFNAFAAYFGAALYLIYEETSFNN
jgi:hypothetical protein